jgi:UDP-N-acetylmuramyl pentapeptide phosphotransferase/UDP-N-acetylglucosamine-1-phosphate transferase
MDIDTRSWRILSEVGLPILFAAMIASAVLILLLFPLLRRYALARPNARSSHEAATPQGGGLAVVAATLLAMLGAAWWIGGSAGALARDPNLLAVVAATLLVTALGLVDDLRPLAPAPRLIFQGAAVALVVVTLPDEVRAVPALPLVLERTALALGLVWFVNLVNFMDGIDWMSVVEIVPLTAGLAILAALGALTPTEGLAALALCGAMLGFAPFNRPVARLFLGDVGSLPIGLLSGWLLTLLAGHGHLAAAVLLPLYYLADATITLVRRLAQGEHFWEAHRTHFYQRARDHGYSVGQVTTMVFVTNVILVALAIAAVLLPGVTWNLLTLLAGSVVVGLVLLRLSRPRPTTRAPRRAG